MIRIGLKTGRKLVHFCTAFVVHFYTTLDKQAKYTDTCVTSFKAKGANDSAANAACHCVAAEAQKIYPTYSALEQAYVEAKGAPEALKPRMMACVQKAKS